ncbi:HAUS augmin-like complex subunit 3 [Chamberlinius hualienensis]
MCSRQFYDTLKLIAYPGVKDLTPEKFEWIVDEYPAFFEWFCHTVGDGNVLTASEVECYKELVSEGIISDSKTSNESFQATFIEEHNASLCTSNDVDATIKEITRKQIVQEIDALNYLQANLCQWQSEKTNKIGVTENILVDCKIQSESAFQQTQLVSCQVNDLVKELQNTLNKLDEQLKKCDGHDSPFQFAHTFISDILGKEFEFNQLLKNFLDTQFPQNLPSESLNDCSSVNVPSNLEQEKLRIEAELLHINQIKVYEKWVKERLLDILEVTKAETLHKIQISIESGTFPTESALRAKIHAIKKELSDKREQLTVLEEKTKSLIHELSDATARSVFIEGVDLKHARQLYFLTKFDEVIDLLVRQTVNSLVVTSLINQEHDMLRNIYQTLQGLYNKLKEELCSKEKRRVAVDELKQIIKNHNYEDSLQNYLKKLAIKQRDDEGQPKKIIGRFGFDVKKFIGENHNKERELSERVTRNFIDQQKRLHTGAENLNKLQTAIWRDCNSFNVPPNIIPKAIAEGIAKLEAQQNLQQETLDKTIAYYKEMK